MSGSEDDNDMVDVDEAKEQVLDLSNPAVVTKYQCAANIANECLKMLITNALKCGLIVDLCQMGDEFIASEVAKVYGKGKVVKGVAFPVSISVNHLAGHFSPLAGDKSELKKGDVVKIDFGVHIDGFAALVAHTLVIPDGNPLSGRKADVISACYTAAQAALRLMVPGQKNTEVTKYFVKSAEAFKCNPLLGVLSHELKQFVIDGTNVISSKTDPDLGIKVDEFEFEANQVYAIDIVMSTGDGKTRELDEGTTVYKRELDNHYSLKMQAARKLLAEINLKHPTYPFTMRAFTDKRAKLGIGECKRHELVQAYPVLFERQGEFVAQLKFTVMLMPSGTVRITGIEDVDLSPLKTEYQVQDEELKALLAQPIKKKKSRRKKKKKSGASAVKDVEMAS